LANLYSRELRRRVGIHSCLLLICLTSCRSEHQPGPDVILVSDEQADVVHILDGRSGHVEGQLKTGERPRGLALSPDGRTLYVAASDSNRIEAWDPNSRRMLRAYAAGSDPERFAVAPDGKSLFVANEDVALFSKLDLASGAIVWEAEVGPEPEGVAVSPDGKLVVGTAETSSTVHFLDAATGKALGTALVGSRPRDVLFVPTASEIWVSSELRGTIAVFDATTLQPKATIDLVPEFPEIENVQAVEMEVTRDGRRAFVAMGRSNQVAEIDPRTRKVVRSFPSGFRTWGIDLAPDESRLYAASGLSGELTIVNLADNEVTDTVQLGGKPWTAEAMAR
jgi:PQQ-dependent catabolism-associated beta-propeller protein